MNIVKSYGVDVDARSTRASSALHHTHLPVIPTLAECIFLCYIDHSCIKKSYFAKFDSMLDETNTFQYNKAIIHRLK